MAKKPKNKPAQKQAATELPKDDIQVDVPAPKLARGLTASAIIADEAPHVDAGIKVDTGTVAECPDSLPVQEPKVISQPIVKEVAEPIPVQVTPAAVTHEELERRDMEIRRAAPWSRLDHYLTVMAPNAQIEVPEILRQHENMYNILVLLIAEEQDDAVAIESIRKLIALFQQHSEGCLGMDMVCRYFDDVRLTEDRKSECETLIFVLLELARVGNRIMVDWEAVRNRLQPSYAESAINRLMQSVNIRLD